METAITITVLSGILVFFVADAFTAKRNRRKYEKQFKTVLQKVKVKNKV